MADGDAARERVLLMNSTARRPEAEMGGEEAGDKVGDLVWKKVGGWEGMGTLRPHWRNIVPAAPRWKRSEVDELD